MPYVSAKYLPPDFTMLPDAPKQVQAIDDQGQVWVFSEDSQVGDWVQYLADGGTIDPADIPINQNIVSAPDTLFGGPTIAQVLGEM